MSKQRRTVTIDSSYGEGGGQILRTACALSAITGTGCRIINIRKNRKNPGLAHQHLMGLRNLSTFCNGKLEGDSLGSKEIFFYPAQIKQKTLNVKIATAGSITLVLQTLLLPALWASGSVRINFLGGATDTFFSPTIDYHRFVFLKVLERLGLKTKIELIRRGFYPKGNAKAEVEVIPGMPRNWKCICRGSLDKIIIISGASEPLKKARVAERQVAGAVELLRSQFNTPIEQKVEYYSTLSIGSQINIIADFENTTLGSDGLGERGKRAETVGQEVARNFLKEMQSGACLDRFAGDQVLPYLSMAKGISTFTVSEISVHAKTNIWVIEQFLERNFEMIRNKSSTTISIF